LLDLESFYQKVVKNNNRKKIFRVLREKKRTTKLDISRILNLSITTVSSNIKEMSSDGLITISGFEDSTGGRKAQIIEYLPDSRFSIGMELKESHARLILTNLDCKIIKECSFDTIDTNILIDECKRIVSLFIGDFNERDRIIGLGISLPGTVNVQTSVLETAPNMYVNNICFKELGEYLQMPVYIENEANCSAYGEYEYNDTFKSPLFYISITEGIGGAIIIDRKLYNGKNHRAGEIGHVSINYDSEKVCSCGNTGCWELYASERALEKSFAIATGDNAHDLDTIFNRMSEPAVKEVITKYARYLAIGIRNLLMTFDPSCIIIGGSISKYEKKLLPIIKEYIFMNNDFYTEKDIEIEFSQLRENSGIIGAALFPIENMV
jgi:predicted NBD/HSP70 family sugar kinase